MVETQLEIQQKARSKTMTKKKKVRETEEDSKRKMVHSLNQRGAKFIPMSSTTEYILHHYVSKLKAKKTSHYGFIVLYCDG